MSFRTTAESEETLRRCLANHRVVSILHPTPRRCRLNLLGYTPGPWPVSPNLRRVRNPTRRELCTIGGPKRRGRTKDEAALLLKAEG